MKQAVVMNTEELSKFLQRGIMIFQEEGGLIPEKSDEIVDDFMKNDALKFNLDKLESLIKSEESYALKLSDRLGNDDEANAFYVGKACACRRFLGYLSLIKSQLNCNDFCRDRISAFEK